MLACLHSAAAAECCLKQLRSRSCLLSVIILPAGGGGAANGPANPLALHTGWLKLRGLPFSASASEIVEWFNEAVQIQPLDINW